MRRTRNMSSERSLYQTLNAVGQVFAKRQDFASPREWRTWRASWKGGEDHGEYKAMAGHIRSETRSQPQGPQLVSYSRGVPYAFECDLAIA
jgi:hypothetical protein